MSLKSISISTAFCIFFSSTALLMAGIYVPMILLEIQATWTEFDGEMKEFRVLSNTLWKDMMSMSTPQALRQGRHAEHKNQTETETTPKPQVPDPTPVPQQFLEPECICDQNNQCPPGPPGPPGQKGYPGEDGIDGKDGSDGADGKTITASSGVSPDTCFHCPPGFMGPPGASGRRGPRGMPGQYGKSGIDGCPASPGMPGEMGPPGAPGRTGLKGPIGERGRDSQQIVGRPGIKGEPGQPGGPGDQGDSGLDGTDGPAGPEGPVGPVGFKGPAGMVGEPGTIGRSGPLGRDAQYCPCPYAESGPTFPVFDIPEAQQDIDSNLYEARRKSWVINE